MMKRKTLDEDISNGDYLGRFYSRSGEGHSFTYKIINFINGKNVWIYLPKRHIVVKEHLLTLSNSERFSDNEVQNFLDNLK